MLKDETMNIQNNYSILFSSALLFFTATHIIGMNSKDESIELQVLKTQNQILLKDLIANSQEAIQLLKTIKSKQKMTPVSEEQWEKREAIMKDLKKVIRSNKKMLQELLKDS